MRVFISWSGESSQAVAQVLAEALPVIIQSVRPFLSVDDLRKGGRWQTDLSGVLQSTSVGIICLTKSNRDAPWILFEAGALSKVVDDSCVMPLLIGMSPSDIRPPLSQFNVTRFDREDFFRLVKDINNLLGESTLPEKVLVRSFDQAWPSISGQINDIAVREEQLMLMERPVPEDPLKKVSAAIDEILTLMRSQAASGSIVRSSSKTHQELERLWLSQLHAPPDPKVTIDLSTGFLADLEKRRRSLLTLLYELEQLAARSGDAQLGKISRSISRIIVPLFRRFLGDDDDVAGPSPDAS